LNSEAFLQEATEGSALPALGEWQGCPATPFLNPAEEGAAKPMVLSG